MYRLLRVANRTTKPRILDRAHQIAALYGLEALTIGRLADEMEMSKAGIYGHFGSKEALQLELIEHARAMFWRNVIEPAQAEPDGVPRLWAMCNTLVSYTADTGLYGGDFWVTVFHEYASRSGPVRDAVEATMNDWMRRLETLISSGIERGQLKPCDPAQLAFEIQALFNAGGQQYRLCHDLKAPERGKAAILYRLEQLRGPAFPALIQ
jgi:AcrR family transcriptional regulator